MLSKPQLGASQFSGIRAPIGGVIVKCYQSPNWGHHNLVVSEPRFRRFWKILGLGGSRIEYMIEKHVFSDVFA